MVALAQDLAQVKAEIGQPRLRTLKAVQRRANARRRDSRVGHLMSATAYHTDTGQVDLRWQIDTYALWQAERKDGRYLLVTNDWSLSHRQIFHLYRAKDGVEKRFHICKSDLQVLPLYLHQDQRIASMLMLNMLALLAYSLLERQVRQQGLQLTTRQLIKRLQQLTLIETYCHDGSCLSRLTPLSRPCFPCSTWSPRLWPTCFRPSRFQGRLYCPLPPPLPPRLLCPGYANGLSDPGLSAPVGQSGRGLTTQFRLSCPFFAVCGSLLSFA